jgi:hypothetical protein
MLSDTEVNYDNNNHRYLHRFLLLQFLPLVNLQPLLVKASSRNLIPPHPTPVILRNTAI